MRLHVSLAIAVVLALAGASGCYRPQAVDIVPPDDTLEEITMESSVKSVPHTAESCRTNCVSCHATGENGAPPQAHPERTECLHCHLVLRPTDALPPE